MRLSSRNVADLPIALNAGFCCGAAGCLAAAPDAAPAAPLPVPGAELAAAAPSAANAVGLLSDIACDKERKLKVSPRPLASLRASADTFRASTEEFRRCS